MSTAKKHKHFVGMDVSDRKLHLCILDESGDIVSESSISNDLESIQELSTLWTIPKDVLIAMETGTYSPWLSHFFKAKGFDVLVGNPRRIRAIWQSDHKTDRRDAHLLARIARFNRSLLYPVTHRSLEAHKDLAVLKARDLLVKGRTRLIGSIRGMLKSFGIRLPDCDAAAFHRIVKDDIPNDMRISINPILKSIEKMTEQIKRLEKSLKKLAEKKYPETIKLQQINGVGPITAMAFVLTIESPDRFLKSRDVGPFLGLVPKKDSSGNLDKELSISKAGNKLLRRLLVGASHYILGPFGTDCDLKQFGEKLLKRGGAPKVVKRKTVVAVSRKLAVKMHAVWKSDGDYNPFMEKPRQKKKNQKPEAA